jgi:magnesium-transporting ATPase (P-type)
LLIFKNSSGTAKGLVIRTGDHTVIGRFINAIPNQTTGDTPITKEISQLISSMACVAVFFGISFFIIALCLGYPLIESFILLMVIIIANAPKGLSITVTVNSDCWKRIRNEFFSLITGLDMFKLDSKKYG